MGQILSINLCSHGLFLFNLCHYFSFEKKIHISLFDEKWTFAKFARETSPGASKPLTPGQLQVHHKRDNFVVLEVKGRELDFLPAHWQFWSLRNNYDLIKWCLVFLKHTRNTRICISRAKPKGSIFLPELKSSIRLLYKWANTAFWLCRASVIFIM